MADSRVPLARRLAEQCRAKPANGVSPGSAGEVLTIAEAFLSMEFIVQHLYIERERVIRAIGMQVDGPDADLDGYPDLAGLVEQFAHQERAKAALAAQQMWQRAKEAGRG